MKRYSLERKESVIQKMMPPHNIPIPRLAKETGISDVTLYNWRKQINVVSDMLWQWCTNVMRSKVEPMKKVARMIRDHFEGIVAWAQTRQTNVFLEALNGLFQSAKRRARGYGSFSTIRTVIFLLAGKLDFSRINPHVAH